MWRFIHKRIYKYYILNVPLPIYSSTIFITNAYHILFARLSSTGEFTDEYRVAFRNEVNSAEDAKSEMMKLFQEAWEREQGFTFTDELPFVTKYAEDILRSRQQGDTTSK